MKDNFNKALNNYIVWYSNSEDNYREEFESFETYEEASKFAEHLIEDDVDQCPVIINDETGDVAE